MGIRRTGSPFFVSGICGAASENYPMKAGFAGPCFCAFLFGVRSVHYGGGKVGTGAGGAVGGAEAGVAAVDVGAAVLAAEDGPFGEYGQTVQCGGAAGAYHRVGENPVVEGDIDAVMVAVESHGLHINISGQQLRAAHPGVGGSVQNCLGTCG